MNDKEPRVRLSSRQRPHLDKYKYISNNICYVLKSGRGFGVLGCWCVALRESGVDESQRWRARLGSPRARDQQRGRSGSGH